MQARAFGGWSIYVSLAVLGLFSSQAARGEPVDSCSPGQSRQYGPPAETEAADVADVPSEERKAGGDPNKRYFLIGPAKGAEAPSDGYRLLIVLPGGDGSADFNPFIRRIFKNGLPKSYLVAQLVAKEWTPGQFEKVVWPTEKSTVKSMEFSTEEFVQTVVKDVGEKHKLDGRHIFTLSWSSGGPAAYAVSLAENTPVTGSLVAMSVFKPDQLPPLSAAKGKPYYLLHSPTDFITIKMAERARDQLKAKGAITKLETYEGGHGWHGDVFTMIGRGIEWLEENAPAKP